MPRIAPEHSFKTMETAQIWTPDRRLRVHPVRSGTRRFRPAVLAATLAVAFTASACSSSDGNGDSSSLTDADGGTAAAVEVDGRTLHLECTGTGSPTVVLQAGFGNAADIWSFSETATPAVQPGLATTNRVCSYDRPGSMITTTTRGGTVALADAPQRGRSDSAPMPRDPADVVTELHDLLAAADVPGPYVMAGHSLGGALSVLYRRTYPEEVGALVVVDSPLPPVRGLVDAEGWEALPRPQHRSGRRARLRARDLRHRRALRPDRGGRPAPRHPGDRGPAGRGQGE